MALLTTYVLPVVAALLFIACLVFIVQGILTRTGSRREAYGFGQQEARTNAQITFWKAAGSLVTALVVLGIWSLMSAIEARQPEEEAVPTSDQLLAPTTTPTATSTVIPTPTNEPATPTSPLPTATATEPPPPTLTPSVTPPPSAVVNSPNGLYLRNAPGGATELELIPDGATLVLLGEEQTADDLVWVRVTTESGNTGWVAQDFIILNQ